MEKELNKTYSGGLEIVFTGHDHRVYEVTKTYSGGAFVHISVAREGALVGSSSVQHIALHIDEIEAVIAALEVLKGK